ncbi:MAG: hypothetical protein FJY67_05070 [Calditrichaeota bacterium]|nr:hypothetical protein [Calditrichota bacterium]
MTGDLSDTYIDHFTHPRGIGIVEKPDAAAEGAIQGEGCFDRVFLTLKVANDHIAALKFRARACSGTIAACSALVEMVEGMSLAAAREVDAKALIHHLGGIPAVKAHSVELAAKVLQDALITFAQEQ